MNHDRFLRILDRLREREREPHGDWCFVALAFCVAFLFPLTTTEKYKPIFGFSPATWETFALWGVILFGTGCLGLSARWCYIKLKFPAKSSEQILAEVIYEMERERERALVRARALAAADAVSTGHGKA